VPESVSVMRRAWSAVKRAALTPVLRSAPLSHVSNRGGWSPWIREPFGGAWQRNVEWSTETVLAHHAVYTCITLIASDIGKLRPKLVQQDDNGIWSEVTHDSPFARVLKRPNRYQNHIQFKEWWITSKLVRGNAYALKERDARGMVKALYLLDPSRVAVLVGEDGSVFYRLNGDNLSGVGTEGLVVPASEIIHDRMNCLFHPLVGISPIYASGLAATVGQRVERNAAAFFENGSNPSGVMTVPTAIPQETADRISEKWARMMSGDNSGAVPVLPHGMTFTPIRMTAVDSQMIEHLKWSAETVCNTFHVPHFKAGVGAVPTYQNGEVLNQVYYSDCLQSHIEAFELAMDEGLGLLDKVEGRQMGVELDLDDLLRMDRGAQMETLTKGVRGGVLTPNGARRKLDEAPLEGGDTIYLQHQDYPMEKVYRRTDLDPAPEPVQPPPGPAADPPEEADGGETRMHMLVTEKRAAVEREKAAA
jgi:HK97 family phage portal protein